MSGDTIHSKYAELQRRINVILKEHGVYSNDEVARDIVQMIYEPPLSGQKKIKLRSYAHAHRQAFRDLFTARASQEYLLENEERMRRYEEVCGPFFIDDLSNLYDRQRTAFQQRAKLLGINEAMLL